MKKFLKPLDVRAFIFGKNVYSIDPATGEFVAALSYNANGSCEVKFANGDIDVGQYGFEAEFYWTRYKNFRAGQTHRFSLEKVSGDSVQAYHEDGSKAYLLSISRPQSANRRVRS